MAAPQTIDEAIDRNAKGPASVTVAGTTVVQKDVAQQIEADKYLSGKRAQRRSHFGMAIRQIVPGGTG
jgi:hypothetical protein